MGDSGVGDKLSAGLFANPDSGKAPATPTQSLEEQMRVYLNYLPQLNSANANSGVQLAQMNQPQYNQLNLEQLMKYGMPTAQANQQIANSNAIAGAQTNNNLLTGAGGQVASNAVQLNKLLNPGYYSVADNMARQTNNLLNSYNTKGLSPGEQNAVERGLNQTNTGTGNLGLTNATNTTANAMNFGGAFNAKLGMLGGALNNATNVANTLATGGGVNPVGVALGTNQPHQGTSFANPGYTTQSADVSQSLLGGINATGNQQQGAIDKFNQYNSERGKLDSWTQGMGNVCCFIFLEANNGTLPEHVRMWRDYYYNKEPAVATGYKRMASWLVPLMKGYSLIKQLVNWTMVKPITHYGGWKSGLNKTGLLCYPAKAFWFTVWKIIA